MFENILVASKIITQEIKTRVLDNFDAVCRFKKYIDFKLSYYCQ